MYIQVSPGLGNAMGMLFNAYSSGTPLLILAGQQDRRLLVSELNFASPAALLNCGTTMAARMPTCLAGMIE